MDIPHPIVLRHRTPIELIDEFTRDWGVRPSAVVLPALAPDGLLYRCEGLEQLKQSSFSEPSGKFSGFTDAVKAFVSLGVDIYLMLDPTAPFVRTDAYHITDIVKSSSSHVCIGNPHSQELMGAILGTGVDIVAEIIVAGRARGKLAGVVIDSVDLWPMSSRQNRIKATCFCDSCANYIEALYPRLLANFRTFPNPWNIALQGTGTGISFFSDITTSTTAADLVGLCKQRGYHAAFGDGVGDPFLSESAATLLKYIDARHRLTMYGAGEIFRHALSGIEDVLGMRPIRVVVMEGTPYDWTCGIHLGRLDQRRGVGREDSVDEVWFDPVSSETALRNLDYRSYMWRRSRYYLDAFFSIVAQAADPVLRSTTGIARLGDDAVRALLRERLGVAMATRHDSTALISLPNLKGPDPECGSRLGFVGVALSEEIGKELIDHLRIAPGLAPVRQQSSAGMAAMLQQMLMQRTPGDVDDDD